MTPIMFDPSVVGGIGIVLLALALIIAAFWVVDEVLKP